MSSLPQKFDLLGEAEEGTTYETRGIGGRFIFCNTRARYQTRISEADIHDARAGNDGDSLSYQRLEEGTWGPTTAINFPLRRASIAAGAMGRTCDAVEEDPESTVQASSDAVPLQWTPLTRAESSFTSLEKGASEKEPTAVYGSRRGGGVTMTDAGKADRRGGDVTMMDAGKAYRRQRQSVESRTIESDEFADRGRVAAAGIALEKENPRRKHRKRPSGASG
ncbi:hypothetical protein FGG08_006792 [Glutinoglossum americanum]|uniref:Uncharacterized protein n=1 Tax=Glutinoglossum americanum TaxID=1670608 RepID=A0A9P8HXL6_9PEZI|nr:hypothetical protein FGG08_006792 [Glutinoglossum americanum]